jgi:DNA-directed RNA polymerase specialized sigma54-like protein
MQKLVMTPQLQMAIRLLQLSTRELLDELPKLAADTPALTFSPRAPQTIGPFPPEHEDPIPEVYAYRDRDRLFVVANVNAVPEFAISGVPVLLELDPEKERRWLRFPSA